LLYTVHSGEEAQKRFRVSNTCVGAITYIAAQFWPYKLVAGLIEILLKNGLNLQTETPVTRVSRNSKGNAWVVHTPRGDIVARTVVHATNGYAQYLLPSFTTITPTRGCMQAQLPPKSLSEPPLGHLYQFFYDNGKLDYLIQQPEYDGNKLIFGGALHLDPQLVTYNDDVMPEKPRLWLSNKLPQTLQWANEQNPKERVLMSWTGIMGFSQDDMPWVGQLSDCIDGAESQWICAGYTGEGTNFHL